MKRKPRTENSGRLLSMTYVPGGAQMKKKFSDYYQNVVIMATFTSKGRISIVGALETKGAVL